MDTRATQNQYAPSTSFKLGTHKKNLSISEQTKVKQKQIHLSEYEQHSWLDAELFDHGAILWENEGDFNFYTSGKGVPWSCVGLKW